MNTIRGVRGINTIQFYYHWRDLPRVSFLSRQRFCRVFVAIDMAEKCHQSDGKRALRACIERGILLGASGVLSKAV